MYVIDAGIDHEMSVISRFVLHPYWLCWGSVVCIRIRFIEVYVYYGLVYLGTSCTHYFSLTCLLCCSLYSRDMEVELQTWQRETQSLATHVKELKRQLTNERYEKWAVLLRQMIELQCTSVLVVSLYTYTSIHFIARTWTSRYESSLITMYCNPRSFRPQLISAKPMPTTFRSQRISALTIYVCTYTFTVPLYTAPKNFHSVLF